MSGITGIWNVNGAPVSRELLAVMSARLAHRGPDGENILLCGSAAFAHQTLRETPESLRELQPARSAESTPVVMLDGRLDNRDELLSALSAHPGIASDAPDSAFVLAAYAAYGRDFVRHLNGDFALAVFDPHPAQPRLFLARDVMGVRTLHYGRFGDQFLFASEIKALLAHPAVPCKPNDHSLAEWLFQLPDYADETNTFFAGVSRVPPGHLLELTPERMTLTRHWDFDVSQQLRLRNYAEYVEAYRACFETAVRKRLRSAFPVAISVSGGLDSSSIYAVAQSVDPPAADLLGIALVGEHPSTNETHYQSLLEERYGTRLTKIPFTAAPATKATGNDTWHSEGPYLKWEVWQSIVRAAGGQGARVVLSGDFGDQILTNPQYILDLVARGRMVAAFQHLRSFSGWRDESTTQSSALDLLFALRGYLVPERLRPWYHRMRRLTGSAPAENLPWFSPAFTALATAGEARQRLLPVGPGRAHAQVLYRHVHAKIPSLRLELSLKTDVQFPCAPAYPFRDRDLIALLMAMPGEMVYRNGSRGIHRDAMLGILPEDIRLRRTKASFLHEAKLGALHDLDSAGPALPLGMAARMGYLAPAGQLTRAVADLRDLVTRSQGFGPNWLVLELLGLEKWLTAFFPGAPHSSVVAGSNTSSANYSGSAALP